MNNIESHLKPFKRKQFRKLVRAATNSYHYYYMSYSSTYDDYMSYCSKYDFYMSDSSEYDYNYYMSYSSKQYNNGFCMSNGMYSGTSVDAISNGGTVNQARLDMNSGDTIWLGGGSGHQLMMLPKLSNLLEFELSRVYTITKEVQIIIMQTYTCTKSYHNKGRFERFEFSPIEQN